MTESVCQPRESLPCLSAQVFVIPLETGHHLVYAPLRRAAFVANGRVVNFLADLRTGTLDTAADPDETLAGFLRRLEILDAGPEAPPLTRFRGEPEPTSVTLFLTTACNLRCTYCYASAGDLPARSMPIEVARCGIDFVAANARRRGEPAFEIAWHGGGEPTANWRVLTESFDYAQDKARQWDLGLKATVATNGVLRDHQIDWIRDHLDGASVSFDGLPELHDQHRVTPLGAGSSDRVMHTLRRLDETGFPYGLRVTVTADQIPRLPESIEFLCSHFHAARIQVEPAYQLGRWRDAPSAETADFIAAFRTAQRCAARFGREILFSAARLGTLTSHFCGASQDLFALSPDGNVSACFEVFAEDAPWAGAFFYGRPDGAAGGYRFDLAVLDKLHRQSVEHREFCRGCFARWSCAGDCYHKSLSIHGDGEFAGSERCHITRELTKDQILTRIANAGGIFWHEPPPEQADSRAAEELPT